jgi:hypothetical protein
MKYLKKFESDEISNFLDMRSEVLDFCSELIDNGIRCDVLQLPNNGVELVVNLDLTINQWFRGYKDVKIPEEGNYSDSIKFLDVYRNKFNFVTDELSNICKRLESSDFKVRWFEQQSVLKNDYFKVVIVRNEN